MSQKQQSIRSRAENLKFKAGLAMLGGVTASGIGAVGIHESLGTASGLDEIGAIMVFGWGPALGAYAVEIAIESGRQEAQMPTVNKEQ